MKRSALAVLFALLLAVFATTACNNKATEHADVKDKVDSAMTQGNLGVVKVAQDRDKGVLTLTGDVISADDKARAEQIAKENAPDYTVANELGVRPQEADASQLKGVDDKLDDGIKDNFKASIKAHKALDDQSIRADVKNGTIVLKGSVKTSTQKMEAAKLAKAVPNVKQVVNELEVKSDKSSTSASAE
ncbi:Putative phosphoslipid binding protein [Candidatus Koribacter versatilis Ellin345]|uniref:Phosphoslipid binding protein n=1 Tax=Koribacter versatilis (strain Ellin345) TaxID=204669 RepID=Q1IKP4_KORVE|nr:BON domain-containing protein [Candidatus Koribacter versatilis]ABF42556.1 Putative phosphoslipid binding protein [Candidatus Koribacter versatilis Ellin345]